MEGALCKHLKIVTDVYKKDEMAFKKMCEMYRTIDLNYDPDLGQDISDKEATKLRNEGNELFKKGDYFKARLVYTQSLAAAIGGPLGAMAYANRSAALFHMNLYEDCLKDIGRSIALEYPAEFRHKLYLRKAKCLKFLGQEYDLALKDAIDAAEAHNKGSSDNLKTSILKGIKEDPPAYNRDDLPKPHKWTLPSLAYGASEEVPSFSSAVTLRHNDRFGRHIVANRDLKTGDVLVVDKCAITALGEEVHWDICMLCFQPCLSLIPCKMCGYVMYCSEKCRTVDWETCHEYSCFFTKCCYNNGIMESAYDQMKTNAPGTLDETRAMSCMLQRIIGTLGLEKLREVAINKEPLLTLGRADPRTRGFKNGKFGELTLESLLSLDDNIDKINNTLKSAYARIALNLAGLHKLPQSQFLQVSAMFFKLILIVHFNQKYICAFKANYYRVGLPRTMFGTGVYLASSLINSACDSNMFQVAYGTTNVYRARRPIKKGEQLTDCYLMSLGNYTYRQRQKYLKEGYGFECCCEACKNTWPIIAQMPVTLNDNLAIMMMESGLDVSDSGEIKKFLYFCQCGIACDKDMLPKMVRLLEKFHKSGKKMHQWYFQIQECIKNHYRAQGNCFFFKNTEDIMNGVVKFDGHDAINRVEERLKNCVETPGPYGLKGWV